MGGADDEFAISCVVRQSGEPRHDCALSRAHDELRADARRASVGKADYRHCAIRVRHHSFNRHHLALASRVRDGIREAGGIPFEFPVHPIQETCKRPTAALDRNLQYLSLVEILYGYPIDGVVLTTGCDKTTPAQLMAAATVDLPAIVFSGGPMLNGWLNGERMGSGTIVWKARGRDAGSRRHRRVRVRRH